MLADESFTRLANEMKITKGQNFLQFLVTAKKPIFVFNEWKMLAFNGSLNDCGHGETSVVFVFF